jgi:predicted NBD/HSP70 family sugar kinase
MPSDAPAGAPASLTPTYTIGYEMASDQIRAAALPTHAAPLPRGNGEVHNYADELLLGTSGKNWTISEIFDSVVRSNKDSLIASVTEITNRVLDKLAAATGQQSIAPKQIAGVGIAIVTAVDPHHTLIPLDDALTLAPDLAPDDVQSVIERNDFYIPLRDYFHARFSPDIRFMMRNRSQLAAQAEFHFGWGAQGGCEKSLVFLTVSRGVGSGIIMNGELLQGSNGLAGISGHIPILDDATSTRCGYCGRHGCLTQVASGTALIARLAQEHNAAVEEAVVHRPGTEETLFDAGGRADAQTPTARVRTLDARAALEAARTDAGARKAVVEVGSYLGRGAALMANLLGPEIVVLGGIAANSAYLINAAQEAARKVPPTYLSRNITIMQSTMDDRAALVGAALEARP